jgi:hypothetical protein
MNGSPSVKVALFIRNGGSESPCRWFYITGIYKKKGTYASMWKDYQTSVSWKVGEGDEKHD